MPAPAVARLSSPGEVLAVLPQLCGFTPTDSLVLVSLRGPRRRIGLTARVDLPQPQDEAGVARALLERMAADGASAVVLALYDGPPRPRLVRLLRSACAEAGLHVAEALHVADGRWTSYSCAGPCCPPEGTPLVSDSPAVRLVAAERTAAGRAVLATRDELVASVAPPGGQVLVRAQEHLAAARRDASRERQTAGPRARRSARRRADALLDRVRDGGVVDGADAAALAVSLDDVLVRDELATRLLDRSDELLALLLQSARLVAPEASAALCAVLAWTAYARGDGALANVALDRALAVDPQHSLALLLRAGLDRGIPPDDVRQVAARTAAALRSGPATTPG